MHKIFIMRHLIYFSIIISLLFISCEEDEVKRPYGTLIEVPNEAITIKDAIKSAQPFDTILLKKGEYFEYDIEINKPLFITSEFLFENDSSIIEQTIINANQLGRVFLVSNVSDTIWLNGLKIINGFASENIEYNSDLELWGYDGGGIVCHSSNLKLTNAIVSDNNASGGSYMKGTGGAFYIKDSYIQLENSKVLDNSASYFCGGIYCDNSSFISENLFIENSTNIGGTTIAFIDSYVHIMESIFKDNPSLNEDYYNIMFARCNGILNKLSVINGIAYETESSIDIIDCNINWY